MVNKDSVKGTLLVALTLCIVCSVVVSTAAVLLKPRQVANVELDRQRNVLLAGGLLTDTRASRKEVEEAFASVTTRYVDLNTGRFTDQAPEGGTGRIAARIPSESERLPRREDPAGISRRENISEVYLVEKNGELQRVILPIRGSGLWGTMFGFIALENDLTTIAGLTFYEHQETPGLGGEVDNPRWKALWPGRLAFADDRSVAIEVIKGHAPASATSQVDGLSGATLTTNGVNNLVRFWLGDQGFGPFLNNLKAGEA